MKNRSLYAVLTRFGIVAAVLTALLVIAPAAAQEAGETGGDCDDAMTCSYPENSTGPVATFQADDEDGDSVTWAVDGTDKAKFTIDGGVLAFASPPDYEMPGDEDHTIIDRDDDGTADFDGDAADGPNNNVYVITVSATEVVPEGEDGPAKADEILVKVTVTNVDEPGEIGIVQRQPQVGQSLTSEVSDPDTREAAGTTLTIVFGYQWSVPKVSRPITDNNAHWTPAGAGTTDAATYTPDADDEGKVLRLQVSYTDAEGADKVMNILTEFPVRAVPTGDNDIPLFSGTGDYTRTIAENADSGTLLGAPVTATDANSDVLYYTLGGTDAASFDIDKITGQITVDGPIDFEDGAGGDATYDITVTAHDPAGGNSTPRAVTVTVTDVNEKPTVTVDGTPTLSTPEIDSTPADGDPAYASALDASYGATDPDAADTGDGNVPGLMLGGDDGALFELGDADGSGNRALTFKDDPNFDKPADANKDNKYEVTVIATDKAGLTGEMKVTVAVTDVLEDGTVVLSTQQPAIGVPITATLDEPDTEVMGVSWQWWRSEDGTTFAEIDDAKDATYTPTAGSPAVEDDPATPGVDESVAAVPSDEGDFLRAVATYTDLPSPLNTATDDEDDKEDQTAMGDTEFAVRAEPDPNTAPAFDSATMMREVEENTPAEGDAGDAVTATDAEGDVIAYSITGGADMDKFTIDEDSGQIMVGAGTMLDYEMGQSTFEVEVTATDPFGLSSSTTVTLTVTDMNEAPELTASDPDDYAENGTDAVATFTATDQDAGDTFSWSIADGADGGKFAIEDGVLSFASPPDYEMPGDVEYTGDPDTTDDDDGATNNVYVLTVKVTEDLPEGDVGPAKEDEAVIKVTVTNVDETGMLSITQRQPQVGVTLNSTVSDPDTRQADGTPLTIDFGYQWSVPKVSRPLIDNNAHWTPGGATDSTSATYSPDASDEDSVLRLQVSYTDAEGADKVMNILTEFAVRAVPEGDNDPPVFPGTGDYTRMLAENTESGTLLGAPVTATDANSDVLYYTIPATGDANPFAIDKITGQITVAGSVHFEQVGGNGGTYTITVTATDPYGTGTDTQDVTVTVTDVNEAPSVTADGANTGTIPEIDSTREDTDPVYTPFSATFTKADPDAGDAAATATTFSLAGDDAGAFDIDNATGVVTFKSNPDFDVPGDANKDNEYKISVVATDDEGLAGMLAVTVEVTDVPEVGKVVLSTQQPAVGVPITATLEEPDTEVMGLSWQWQRSQDGTTYENIDGAEEATYTPADKVPDDPATEDVDETDAGDEGYFLQAVATYTDLPSPLDESTADDLEDKVDQMAMDDTDFAVRVEPVPNTAPAFDSPTMTRTVEENTAAEGDAGDPVTATDAEEDVIAYSITGGADMDKFTIDEATGQIKVGDGTMLDFEMGQTSFELVVTATDPFGLNSSTTVTLTVTDMNEAPSLGLRPPEPEVNVAPAFADDATTTFMVYENMAAGTAVGQVEATDENDVLAYTDDSDYFAVDGDGNITTAAMLDYESAASHTVTITATDDDADAPLSDSITVTVNVGDAHPGCATVKRCWTPRKPSRANRAAA